METSPIRSSDPIKSLRLADLEKQLRLYKAPLCPLDSDGEESEVDDRGKVFSPMAVVESVVAPSSLSGSARFRFKTAAVLICLFEDSKGELRVILTKRSSNLHTSPGEVSLPGGKAEEGDKDEKETAIREAKEEIGLQPDLVSVVAVLEPLFTKRLLRVVPVVCIFKDKDAFKPVLNPDEVEELFDAPLKMFLKDENRRAEDREWQGIKYLLHFFDYTKDDTKYSIWGLTAAILIRAASVVYQRSPSFTEQHPNYWNSIFQEIRKLVKPCR
jgi:coenzyme A diphosphatase NUDT7